jgi:hypothetical protein
LARFLEGWPDVYVEVRPDVRSSAGQILPNGVGVCRFGPGAKAKATAESKKTAAEIAKITAENAKMAVFKFDR